MEKYSETLGLPVIAIDTGGKIGTVKDMIFCPAERRVKALLMERKGCEIARRILPVNAIASLGRDAVIVNDCASISRLRKADRLNEDISHGKVIGFKIFCKNGQDLGIVKDVIFDQKTWLIEGVEVSDGLFQDLYQGRKLLPLFGKVEFASDNILVDREALEEITGTGGGIKNLLAGKK